MELGRGMVFALFLFVLSAISVVNALCVPATSGLLWPVHMSKRVLRIVALVLLLGALATWLGTGANCGWTKTSVPVRRTDAVTGLSVDDYQQRFVPGLDFLGAAGLGAGILAGASFLFRDRQRPT
jgi:hypothetical protein